ncbi:MAG: bifunctional homocysteine S-methyltransferase/methylenetetrahydrofolate reductase [Actinomycetota bacterium]
MDRAAFADLLRAGPLLADGGLATSLADRGIPFDACFEELNVEQPDLVRSVHRSFVQAGARVVWTNSFGGNRFKLARHGVRAERVAELAEAAVAIAREAVEAEGVSVAGSIGPLGVWLAPYGRVRSEEAREAYAEQAAALASAGVDLFVVETQTDLVELEQAVLAVRSVAPGVPLVASATFTTDDRTPLGSPPDEVAARLRELDVDAIGVNCGQGPAQALRVIRRIRGSVGSVPLLAKPNAGGPQQIGGRFLYPATPGYFGELARNLIEEGVAVLGGCCGTGPEHVGAMADALERGPAERHSDVRADTRADVRLVEDPPPVASAGVSDDTASALERRLDRDDWTIAVEMEPPRSHSPARLVAAAQTLVQAGADVIDVADSPMAKMRMSPWAACRAIEERVGVETVLHFPTRGRNLLRLQGDLLAIHALGVRNLFVCLGDPVTIGDYPHGTDAIDVTPTGLMALVTGGFNAGSDHAGSSIGEPTRFLVGCALSPSAPDLGREVKLLRKKVDAGARFALSQPMYSLGPLERLVDAYEARHGELSLRILAGVLPLASRRHAEFIHNEVPGVVIPPEVLDRIRKADHAAEGLAMATELVEELAVHPAVAGVYLMPQFGRFDLAAEVVESARRAGDR